MQSLATPSGVIGAVAVDQRSSLRRLIADARGVPADQVVDNELAAFKRAVAKVLSHYASAILIDTEFGISAFNERAAGCGLLATYESDGYENPRPNRMLALMPGLSVYRLRELGAQGIKILLSYNPFGDTASNDEKCAMIERIGNECDALDMPFFLEPVGYDPGGLDPKSFEYAQRKPEIVIGIMEEFSKPIYKVDVLKVEFPVNASFVEGCAVFCGQPVHSRHDALEWFRRADAIAAKPYIYLSAGVSGPHFIESLQMANEVGAGYSGVLCGRATWQGGVPVFAHDGVSAFEQWLSDEGVRNVEAVNECLAGARPWHERLN